MMKKKHVEIIHATPEQPYRVSTRLAERAINTGTPQRIHLAWPQAAGEYGQGDANTVDAIIDRYVEAVVARDADVQVIGVCAGRTDDLVPVVVVTVGRQEWVR